MGSKRSRVEAELPETVEMVPLEGDNDSNAAVYFPSGFDPNDKGADCEWQAYKHATRKKQYTVVAKTVRLLSLLLPGWQFDTLPVCMRGNFNADRFPRIQPAADQERRFCRIHNQSRVQQCPPMQVSPTSQAAPRPPPPGRRS
jgi:hypothetical protein